MDSPILEAVQLTKFHGHTPALVKVDLALRPGEVLALLGHNGAGKTTLLNLLALLTWPSQGEVRMFGQEMSGEARLTAKSSIGLLGHQTFLYDELTALENLQFFARLYGIEDGTGRALERLELVGLSDVRDELVRHFSRGMRQRLALARAFLHDPALACLDEPFTGLDESALRTARRIVAGCRDAGRTVVLSSHDLDLALELATTVLVLERGRVVHFGPRETETAARYRAMIGGEVRR